jgi:hypothetical protein
MKPTFIQDLSVFSNEIRFSLNYAILTIAQFLELRDG